MNIYLLAVSGSTICLLIMGGLIWWLIIKKIVSKRNIEKKVLEQLGCSDEEYERLKKQTLEEMKEHPLKRKLRLYIALLVFVGMIVLMFVAWKNDW